MNYLKFKYQQICRICESSDSLTLTVNLLSNVPIKNKLLECTKIEFDPNDELPKHLCQECCVKLELSYLFKIKCETADKKLREALRWEAADCDEDNDIKSDAGSTGFTEETEDVVLVKDEPEETSCKVNPEASIYKQDHINYYSNRLKPQLYNCPSCKIQVKGYCEYLKHKKTHRFNCSFCVLVFAFQSSLDKHIKERHKRKEHLTFKCDHCDRRFARAKFLKNHIIKLHKLNENPLINEIHNEMDASEVANISLFDDTHLVLVKGEPVGIDDEMLNDVCTNEVEIKALEKETSDVSNTTKSQRKTSFDCPYCEIKLKSYFELLEHKRQHKKFNCNFCIKYFTLQTTLDKHIEERHKDSKQYTFQCDQCHRRFTSSRNLEHHIKVYHSNEKEFACDQCDYKAGQKSALTVHKKSHNVNRQFDCQICNQVFISSRELYHHKRQFKHYNPNKCHRKVYKLKCKVCGLLSNSMSIHMRTHTGEKPFICDICGRQFTTPRHLKNHLLVHAGTKPHKCELCDKSFTERSSLTIHMQNHVGKRHKCTECPKAYTKARNLRIHQATHSKP